MTGGSPLPAAYGLRVSDLEPTPWLAVHEAERWPILTIERDPGTPDADPWFDPVAQRALVGTGVELDELVHPLLGRIALAWVRANGGDALHAGAIAGEAGAWAIVGATGSGKSTLLEAWVAAGGEVLTDDVLVLRDGCVLAGPRCLDLRVVPPPGGPSLLPVRRGSRLRASLAPGPAEQPLVGTVHLAWDEEPSLRRLTPSEVVAALLQNQSPDGFPRDPSTPLDIAALPAFELRRPRDVDRLSECVALIEGLVAAAPGPTTPASA